MSLIDEFENSFKACMAPFTNPISSHVFEKDEIKANVDNVLHFIDMSRQVESFFIQKRAILIDQKPELILLEEINELKNEINRKEIILTKYHDKLDKWTAILNENGGGHVSNGHNGHMPVGHPQQSFRAPVPPGQQSMMTMSPGMRPPPPSAMMPQQPPIYYKQAPGQKNASNMSASPAGHFTDLGGPSQLRAPRPSMQASMSPGSMGSPMGVPSPHAIAYGAGTPGQAVPSQSNASQLNSIALLERTTSNIGMIDRKQPPPQ